MKTAIYIEDGVAQLVITPETEYEKANIGLFEEGAVDAKIMFGSFYDCRGGWVRQSAYQPHTNQYWQSEGRDKSLIIKIEKPKAAEE